MRDLEAVNPGGMKPSRLTSFSGGVVVLLSLICLPLAHGAAPDTAFMENPIVLLLLLITVVSMTFSMASLVFSWGWETVYFGPSMICISSVSLLAIIPLLSLLIYGTVSLLVKLLVFAAYVVSHVWWGRKFVTIYRDIYDDAALRALIYEDESDAIYYNRSTDTYLLEKRYKFSQMPPDGYFIVFIVLAFMLLPFTGILRSLTGLPFAHIFLVVSMVPISWMGIGLALRGFLVCYFYPAQLKRATGKEVYIDLVRKHPLAKSKRSVPGKRERG